MVRDLRKSRIARLVAVVALMGLIATGCGDDDTDQSADETERVDTTDGAGEGQQAGDGAAGDTPDMSELRAELEDLLAGDVDLPAPEEPVDSGTHEVAIVAAGLASSGPATVVAAIEEALDVAGWSAPPAHDGEFAPTEQAAGISTAVAQGAEAIFLVAITPSAVSAAVAEAQNAGIPILCILCGPDPITEGITNIEADADAAGRAQALYAAVHSDGEGTVVLYKNEEFEFSAEQGEFTEQYLAELCPGCTVDVRTALLAESREPNAEIHTSLLNEYGEGELDFVIFPFDSPAGALATTASQLGRTDFGIIGYGALSPFVDMIGTGEPAVAKASVTISSPYYGWAAVDEAVRILAGEETWDAASMPVAMITQENFSDYPEGLPYLYPDFEFSEYFGELWNG